jgi:hypothetical protein
MKIVTRGYGQSNLIITRGYGRSILEVIYREVIKLTTSFNQRLKQTTSFCMAVRLATGIGRRLRMMTSIGGAMARVKLVSSFSQRLQTSHIVQFGRLVLSNIFKVANRIKLFCGFDLRRR